MKAVVLAGGFSTRLRPLTNFIPKPLVPVVNKPIIEHVVDRLVEADVRDVVFTLHYRAQEIIDHFGDGGRHGIKPTYIVEGEPLGTAGSVKNVEHLLDEDFLVVSGDILFDFDLRAVIKNHFERGSRATIVLSRVDSVEQFGVAELDSDGRVVGFVEKPDPAKVKSRLVNAGIYVLNKSVLKLVEKGVMTDFSLNVFPKLVRSGELYGYSPEGFWYDVGTFQGLLKAQHETLAGRTKIKIPGKRVVEGIYVQGDVDLSDPEKLVGPAVIGGGSKVGDGVTLRYASVGPRVTLGVKSTLVDSMVMEGCLVGGGCVLTNVVLGRRCTVSPNKTISGPVGFGDGAQL